MGALLLLFVPSLAYADTFYATFGDGKAEVSSYKIVQPRYGEKRAATGAMVFVPEDIHRDSRIKVENYAATPEKDRLPVLKLNRVLHFNTGIYDYSAMTSVFASVGESFAPRKISITVSEWCGNFFEQLLPEAGGAKRVMHSYFEAEGDRDDYLKAPKDGVYEDALPILIRELREPWLKVGEHKAVKIMPALWESRLSHEPLDWRDGSVEHAEATKWVWKVGARVVTYRLEAEYPHTIVAWESSTGEKGDRIKTLRLPYWSHHAEIDAKLRRELGLP